ncbi:hypothetical protein [Gimesia algae]|uniref:DUF4280 domain-containing protein n=1 Tax=Gimesia algae TaxID=2527971 RepID=A0A517VBU9_9PLAN|nr:hypothetical protein [Gimesia algae]QDT90459.1 hypothetical protein Pan161_21110 [Gimesia algae]
MPGFLLHVGAQVQCLHAGNAQPMAVNSRVLVSGQPTVQVTSPYSVSGCTMPSPTAGNGPCVTGQWTTSATRVTSMGQPLLLQDSQATCIPTGTGLLVITTQTRVTGN